MTQIAASLASLGFKLVATSGTADVLEKAGLSVERTAKLAEEGRNVIDLM